MWATFAKRRTVRKEYLAAYAQFIALSPARSQAYKIVTLILAAVNVVLDCATGYYDGEGRYRRRYWSQVAHKRDLNSEQAWQA